MNMEMLEFSKYDIVRLAYGALSTVDRMGLERAFRQYVNGVPFSDEED